MLKYVGKRLIYMVGVFFVVSIILFILFNNVPGDRALNQVQNLRGKVSDETFQLRYQEARDKLGLDDPIPVRYVKWMGNLLRGDFGYSSFYKKDVIDVLGTPLLNTIQINIMATIIALAITIPLGIHCAVKKFSRFDNAIQVLTIVGYSMPQYIVALVFIFLFSVKLGWFPMGMSVPKGVPADQVTILQRIHHLILPALTLSFLSFANVALHTREKLVDVLESDYVLFAKARGESKWSILKRHGLRNIMLPAITMQFGSFSELFGGSVLAETVFSYPGLGAAASAAGMGSDIPLLLGITLFSTLFVFVGNMLANIIYGIVDPQIREGYRNE